MLKQATLNGHGAFGDPRQPMGRRSQSPQHDRESRLRGDGPPSRTCAQADHSCSERSRPPPPILITDGDGIPDPIENTATGCGRGYRRPSVQ